MAIKMTDPAVYSSERFEMLVVENKRLCAQIERVRLWANYKEDMELTDFGDGYEAARRWVAIRLSSEVTK